MIYPKKLRQGKSIHFLKNTRMPHAIYLLRRAINNMPDKPLFNSDTTFSKDKNPGKTGNYLETCLIDNWNLVLRLISKLLSAIICLAASSSRITCAR